MRRQAGFEGIFCFKISQVSKSAKSSFTHSSVSKWAVGRNVDAMKWKALTRTGCVWVCQAPGETNPLLAAPTEACWCWTGPEGEYETRRDVSNGSKIKCQSKPRQRQWSRRLFAGWEIRSDWLFSRPTWNGTHWKLRGLKALKCDLTHEWWGYIP